MKISNKNYFLIGGIGVGVLIILAFIFFPSNETTTPSFEPEETAIDWSPQDLNAEIQEMQNLIITSPTADNYFVLGLRLIEAQRFQEAVQANLKAIELDPNRSDIYNNLGWSYISLGMWDEAVEVLEKGLEIDPDSELIENNLSVAKEGQEISQ